MDNPGLDAINVEADDILSERRQKEIAELLDKLALYKPTKIAIEADYKSTHWQERYKKYLNGDYKLGRNEIEQIGFQLAKRLNLPTLYPIDYPMLMGGLLYSEIEYPKGKPQPTSEKANKEPKPLSEEEKLLRKMTVTQYLIKENSKEEIEKSHRQYMEMLLPDFENVAIYTRADRVSNWYKRNLRMFSNLNRISEFNGQDRILLIVGSGHLKILKDFTRDSPQFCLIETGIYLNE